MSRSESAVRSEKDGWGLAAILALCGFFIFMRWTKMDSLYNIDPAMWLSQIARFAHGEMPYRDFAYLYPPLTIFLLGSIARVFGPTFAVVQTAMDLIGLTIALLSWHLVRHLLPPSIRTVTVAAVVVINATTLTMFNLFSFSTYSPALEIGAIGLFMVLIGGVRQLERGTSSTADFGLIAGGIFIATIAKPEATLAAWGSVILLFAIDSARRWRWYASICVVAGMASAAVYLSVGAVVGFQNLKTGVGGYGMATFA